MPVNLRCKCVSYDIMTKTAVSLFERSLDRDQDARCRCTIYVCVCACVWVCVSHAELQNKAELCRVIFLQRGLGLY